MNAKSIAQLQAKIKIDWVAEELLSPGLNVVVSDAPEATNLLYYLAACLAGKKALFSDGIPLKDKMDLYTGTMTEEEQKQKFKSFKVPEKRMVVYRSYIHDITYIRHILHLVRKEVKSDPYRLMPCSHISSDDCDALAQPVSMDKLIPLATNLNAKVLILDNLSDAVGTRGKKRLLTQIKELRSEALKQGLAIIALYSPDSGTLKKAQADLELQCDSIFTFSDLGKDQNGELIFEVNIKGSRAKRDFFYVAQQAEYTFVKLYRDPVMGSDNDFREAVKEAYKLGVSQELIARLSGRTQGCVSKILHSVRIEEEEQKLDLPTYDPEKQKELDKQARKLKKSKAATSKTKRGAKKNTASSKKPKAKTTSSPKADTLQDDTSSKVSPDTNVSEKKATQ